MTVTRTFDGFPAAGLEFLKELQANNNRAWFNAHKDDYTTLLRDPLLNFIVILGECLQDIVPGLIYDTRTNGAGSMMRINRDTRFSTDKTPYKTHVTAMFWEGPGKKTANPGFGIRLEADGGGLMAGLYSFPKPMLNIYRQAVATELMGEELVQTLAAIHNSGEYTIGGEYYRRVPNGYDLEHPRADLLRYAGLYVFSPHLDVAVLTSPDLVEVCVDHFRVMAPVQRWLIKARRAFRK